MKKKINVIVVEDNMYYNVLLSNALQQSIHFIKREVHYQLVLQSFVDSRTCMQIIESPEFRDNYTIAFVDYNVGNGITGTNIIDKLKMQNSHTQAILLTQSTSINEKEEKQNHDYFVVKDTFAPALCRLYLDQYIEDNFS